MIRYGFFKQLTALSLIASVTAVTGCATVKTHPEFADRHAQMKKIAVLPPDTQVYEVTFNAGNKPLADLTEIAKKHTAGALAKTLETKGYEVTPISVEQKDLDADPALKEAIFNIHALYKKATEDITKNKKPSFTYDIGSSPNYFAEKNGVNALIVTRQVGNKLSDGTVAAQAISTTASVVTTVLLGVSAGGGMSQRYTLLTEIAVVDADLGDILWYHLGQTNENYTKVDDPKPIEKSIDAILKVFPDSKFKKPGALKAAPPKAPADTAGKAAGQNFVGKKAVSASG